MKTLKHSIESFLADEDGASAVEYGLLVALVVAVVAVGVTKLGSTTNTAMSDACKQVNKGTAC
jgi:pilus assembly protein Flp/PilA